jgi:hypothetical protein
MFAIFSQIAVSSFGNQKLPPYYVMLFVLRRSRCCVTCIWRYEHEEAQLVCRQPSFEVDPKRNQLRTSAPQIVLACPKDVITG